jgi:hypothetical protein
MSDEAELAEYMAEIREQVCSRCVERPPGGPPCAPLGKSCGVELHLPQLLDSIRAVDSALIGPYLEHNRQQVCEPCAFLHSGICPCPMDYLAVLLVQAVEAVDHRRQRRERGRRVVAALSGGDGAGLAEIARAYEQGTGTWTGCDWPTRFGKTGLDLNGRTVAEAEARKRTTTGVEAADWRLAARWLWLIELHAAQAETHAQLAVQAAGAGDLGKALDHANRAWALEFATGRPLRRGGSEVWKRLRRAVEAAVDDQAEVVPTVTVG